MIAAGTPARFHAMVARAGVQSRILQPFEVDRHFRAD